MLDDVCLCMLNKLFESLLSYAVLTGFAIALAIFILVGELSATVATASIVALYWFRPSAPTPGIHARTCSSILEKCEKAWITTEGAMLENLALRRAYSQYRERGGSANFSGLRSFRRKIRYGWEQRLKPSYRNFQRMFGA